MSNPNPIFNGWKYNAPKPGCNHWSITNANGEEIGCPCTGLPVELIDFINTHSNHATEPEILVEPAPSTDPAPAFAKTFPTPATVSFAPVEYPDPVVSNAVTLNTSYLDNRYEITATARQYIIQNGLTEDDVLDTLYSPYAINPSRGNEIYYGENANVVVGGQNQYLVISVLPPRPPRRNITSARSNSGGQRTMRFNSVRELVEHLEAQGVTVTLRDSGHYMAILPDDESTPPVFFPSTPSDKRSLLNAVSELKRKFGISFR